MSTSNTSRLKFKEPHNLHPTDEDYFPDSDPAIPDDFKEAMRDFYANRSEDGGW